MQQLDAAAAAADQSSTTQTDAASSQPMAATNDSVQSTPATGAGTGTGKRILVISILTHGHLNMCIGIGRELLARGNRVCFAVSPAWQGKLAVHGFDEIVYEVPEEQGGGGGQGSKLAEFACAITEQNSGGIEFRVRYFASFFRDFVEIAIKMDPIYASVVDRYRPDVILSEDAAPMPYLERAGRSSVCSVDCFHVFGSFSYPKNFLGRQARRASRGFA